MATWPIRGASADVSAVTPAGKEVTVTSADIAALDGKLAGDVLTAKDAPYEEARKLWNGSFDRKPALIARCQSPADVAAAVRFAREKDLLVAVRSGGHSYSGQSSVDNGMMIDMQPMKALKIDTKARIATAASGVFLGEFDRAAQAHGLATTAGTVPHTGLAGLTLGGGVGRLMRIHGMTIDNLLAVDLITAEGKQVRASATEHPDLFWGVRGGAGNFGVATSFEYKLHEVGPNVQVFSYRYAAENIRQVMKFFFEYTNNAPDHIHTSGA
ncbi:MAG: FAD-binding oxidoreductase, partial [Alphaproteobacteria bacterium]|nr:FAD-binding oxidoreductase [Alphaproteobacteria bacterium]